MDYNYYNHYAHIAANGWERRSFLAHWWRIYAGDSYWVPPYYPLLRRAIAPAKNGHLARLKMSLTYLEALPAHRRSSTLGSSFGTMPLMEAPVAAAAALGDPRRQDRTAYLSLFECVNDVNTLEKLIDSLSERLLAQGYRRLIGPTGLSPHLGSGVLQDYWGEVAPLHTPYNPPYLPEMIEQVLRPFSRGQLYQLDVPSEPLPTRPTPAKLSPLTPARLSEDLLPLFTAACLPWPRADFAPPDTLEVNFLLEWLQTWPLPGWLAEVDNEPVGFVLLQSDLAPTLRRAQGGRRPWWRLWLNWASRRPTRQGRLLYLAVLPNWQRRGIGSQLLQRVLAFAREQGWQRLTIGPIPSIGAANKFLQRHDAEPRQSYLLYQKDL